jgi:VanZ family protein
VVLYIGLIFFVSSQPRAPLPETVSDKTAHLLAYLVLGVLSVRAAGGGLPCRVTVPIALTALAVTSGYGALDEWRQGFVQGRSQDINDWYADTAGAVVGIGVCWAWGMIRALGRRSP